MTIKSLRREEAVTYPTQLRRAAKLTSLSAVPARTTGVYATFAEDDQTVIYIGQSVDVRDRLYKHKVAGRLVKSFVVIKAPKSDLNKVEDALIKYFKPAHNKVWNPAAQKAGKQHA